MTRFRRMIPALFSALLVACAAIAAGPRAPAQDSTENDVVTRKAICRWAAQPPVLDGNLDDACWKDAVAIRQFASYWDKKTPRPGMVAYFLWDRDNLYYAARMLDTEVRSAGTKRNDTLWDGDVFEMFFKPSDSSPKYYEFQANPKSLVFECYFPSRGVYPADIHKVPVLGNTAVATVDGTLDQPGDTDKSWTVEGRIPWTAFQPTGGQPRPGAAWKFALCRYDYGPQGTKPVLMSSAPLSRASFHQTEDYGTLQFEGPPR